MCPLASAGRMTSPTFWARLREVQKKLRAGVDRGIRRIEQDASNLTADLRTARLDCFDHNAALIPEAARQMAELRGLAATVHAFERDESAGVRSVMHGTWIFSDGNVPS